jgi:hypothetical protein
MKAILIAALFGLLLFGAASVGLRYAETTRRAWLLTLLFLCTLPPLVLVHLATPEDLGFLPPALVLPFWLLDLGFSVFLFAVGFAGGLLQLYNLADRGLSLRILIDILESRGGALSAEDIVGAYGGGKGIVWMYQKRLDDMLAAGLIEMHGDTVGLTAKGRRTARLFDGLRKFFRAGPPMRRAA